MFPQQRLGFVDTEQETPSSPCPFLRSTRLLLAHDQGEATLRPNASNRCWVRSLLRCSSEQWPANSRPRNRYSGPVNSPRGPVGGRAASAPRCERFSYRPVG